MTAWAAGAWRSGAWKGTAWATVFIPPAPATRRPGGGRVFAFTLPPPKTNRKVVLQLPKRDTEKEKELARLVKLDAEQRARDLQSVSALADVALEALNQAKTVQISADLTQEQISRFRKRLEEEDVLLLLS